MARRITLVIHSLHGGGAERIAVAMANHWSAVGHQVTLITLDKPDNDIYKVSGQVNRIGLDLMHDSPNAIYALYSNIRRLTALRRSIRNSHPDVVVSLVVHTNILTLLACRGLGLDVVVCEHTDPRHQDIGRLWSRLRRIAYPRCRALTVLTNGVVDFARTLVGTKPIYVLPNPVLVETVQAPQRSGDGNRYVVAMGRLAWAKGFERLIEAFSTIASKNENWRLKILGEGPDREMLERRIKELNLLDQVELTGWIADPYDELRNSDLCVMSSRFEGFPMVLLEAMACRLPVVSFDCESGPAEIIRDGIDGILVPANDIEKLATAMDRLMSDDELREQLASRAPEVSRRFSKEIFFRRWEAILNSASQEEFAKLGSSG